jgi:hypothetical protein
MLGGEMRRAFAFGFRPRIGIGGGGIDAAAVVVVVVVVDDNGMA